MLHLFGLYLLKWSSHLVSINRISIIWIYLSKCWLLLFEWEIVMFNCLCLKNQWTFVYLSTLVYNVSNGDFLSKFYNKYNISTK